MTIHYADTSAWLKLVYDEAETEDMLDHLAEVQGVGGRFASSHLLATELHRAGRRLGVTTAGINEALREVDLILPTEQTYRLAGRLPGETLRSLDALHLASAIEAEADAFVTYDERQAVAASEAGLVVVSPGT